MKFVVEKINDHTGEYDNNANDNNPFSGVAVHITKVRLNNTAINTYCN